MVPLTIRKELRWLSAEKEFTAGTPQQRISACKILTGLSIPLFKIYIFGLCFSGIKKAYGAINPIRNFGVNQVSSCGNFKALSLNQFIYKIF